MHTSVWRLHKQTKNYTEHEYRTNIFQLGPIALLHALEAYVSNRSKHPNSPLGLKSNTIKK